MTSFISHGPEVEVLHARARLADADARLGQLGAHVAAAEKYAPGGKYFLRTSSLPRPFCSVTITVSGPAMSLAVSQATSVIVVFTMIMTMST